MNVLLSFISQVVRLKSAMGRPQRYEFKVFVGLIISFLLIYWGFQVIFKNELIRERAPTMTGRSPSSSDTPRSPQITLLLRMPGKVMEHRARYYCDFFRSTVLFWPPSFGKTVIVLDEESQADHEFGEIVINHTRKHFPEYRLEVKYEALPKDKRVLEFPGAPRSPGYNRQLWSSFF